MTRFTVHGNSCLQESKQLRELRLGEDKDILAEATVIGMTTTGAASYRRVLAAVACPIVILEEAAEVSSGPTDRSVPFKDARERERQMLQMYGRSVSAGVVNVSAGVVVFCFCLGVVIVFAGVVIVSVGACVYVCRCFVPASVMIVSAGDCVFGCCDCFSRCHDCFNRCCDFLPAVMRLYKHVL